MSEKLWNGRFSEETDKLVEAFTSSIEVDRRLYAYDIEGSIAHCKMLAKTAIIPEADAQILISGLFKIKADIEKGDFSYDDSLEDIHMHIESRLARDVGKAALKLHTARSRNDQVALDVRMYLRKETENVMRFLIGLRHAIVELAKSQIHVIMPGYTHLQRAQPVLLSHHLMAYYEMLKRDTERFRDGLKRTDVMPLGSAALAGTTYPIDREYTAELLDFPKVSANSIDSVSDRDFIIEFLSASSICMVHLSRMSEELILWSSAEFGFIELPDAFATGSSIMPQKKNPDVAELIRGKSGRVFGNLISLLTMMKSLPLAYNRDMQEDKKPLFETVDTVKACLRIYINLLPKLGIKIETLHRASNSGYLNATDLADYLVSKGMSFREAHGCVGRAVSHAIAENKELHELDLDVLKTFSERIEGDVFSILTPEAMVNRRLSAGGTATSLVRDAIKTAETELIKESGNLKP